MLRDVTIASLLCLCIMCYKMDVPASWLIREQEHFCRNVMVSVGVSRMGKANMIFIDPGAKVNSSYHFLFILGQGLLPDIQATFRQYKSNGHINRMVHRRTQHVIPQIIWRKRRLISSSLTCGPQTAPILILETMLFEGALQQGVYHGRKCNTVEKLKQPITTDWKKTAQLLSTIALMNGVVVLNVLLRITVDISNNVILFKWSRVLSFSYFSYFLRLIVDH